MITKAGSRQPRADWVIAASCLAIGIAIGWVFRPANGGDDASTEVPATSGPFRTDPGVAPHAELATLHIEFSAKDTETLQGARDRAMARGGIETRAEDIVSAKVRFEAEGEVRDSVRASIRLKGDMQDHIDTDKWSLRIEIDNDRRLGMRSFSVQHPKTRGYIAEWLLMTMARRLDLLAPRARFVNVVINDRPNGVYYLEEHFGKELLEGQGRREGPIVRFREDSLWATWLQHGYLSNQTVPSAVELATTAQIAEVDAFESKRLTRDNALNVRLVRAIDMLRDVQRRLVVGMPRFPGDDAGAAAWRLDELDALAGRTIEDLFAADRVGDWLALASLWGAAHGLGWHQWRLYHDPVRDRLEPVVFDMDPSYQALLAREGILLTNPLLSDLTRSHAIRKRAFRTLWRISDDAFIDQFFGSIASEYAAIRNAIAADPDIVPEALSAASLLEALERAFRDHARWVRGVLAPDDAANFACRIFEAPTSSDDAPAMFLEVEAWAITQVPVEVIGFRFSNGRFVPAGEVHVEVRPNADVDPEGRVLLPRDARHAVFRIPADLRLVGLRRIQELKRAIRQAIAAGDGAADIELTVAYRTVPNSERIDEPLSIVRVGRDATAGRPKAPSLHEALEHHVCLGFEPERRRLFVRPGDWTVSGDLVTPAGFSLHCEAGTTLRFAAGAALIANGPLVFEGTAAAPIRLEPQTDEWAGVVVIDADAPSRWSSVHVRATRVIDRGGWQTTGGVTFYRAPVALSLCRFENALGEDALNVFGARCEIDGCAFAGGASDLFDGDFVTGFVRDSTFSSSGEDAIDVSGSNLEISSTRFDAIGDKAISIGEDSDVTINSCSVKGCGIGVAAKDSSDVVIDRLRIDHAKFYALTAYVKKREFGAATIDARNVVVGTAGRGLSLVQTGCRFVLDGIEQATSDVDVERLYREQVLGK